MFLSYIRFVISITSYFLSYKRFVLIKEVLLLFIIGILNSSNLNIHQMFNNSYRTIVQNKYLNYFVIKSFSQNITRRPAADALTA